MTTSAAAPRYLTRGIDYLGSLGMKLRDLRGYATLAFELLQNADDADNATFLRFDLRDEALIVDNDGVFTDCGNMDADECPWKSQPGVGHRCDFHRFRRVAGADKRNEAGTTGAFGIGFTAVYQITDSPELVSGGRHWVLQETRPETERILVCPGCARCQAAGLLGTRFILPWVKDTESEMRRALSAQAVDPSAADHLAAELTRTLPTAILFLRRLHRVEVLRNGQALLQVAREDEGDLLLLDDGSGRMATWHLLRGDFSAGAQQLREKYPNRIEDKRSAAVIAAIPEDPSETGLLCAFLPTQHETGLPFLVNADFFPSSSRKRIIFESDYQSEWNRAAVEAAARAVANSLPLLPHLLGHEALWHLIAAAHSVALDAEQGRRDPVFASFWRHILPEIVQHPVVLSSRGQWKRASEIYFTEQDAPAATEFYEALGLPIVHPSLRPHYNLLRRREIGVVPVDTDHLVGALEENGLVERTERDNWPEALTTAVGLATLWSEVAGLLARPRKADELKATKAKLTQCAIALGRDGALWPCLEIFRAEPATVALFSTLDPGIPFLADLPEESTTVARLCPEFTVLVATARLQELLERDPEHVLTVGLPAIFAWFDSRRDELAQSVDVRSRIVDLPIFPSATGLRRLRELPLPGDFTDPIGLADLLDLERTGGRRELMVLLGARALDFLRYAGEYIPRAFQDSATPADKKEGALHLLTERLSQIRENQALRSILSRNPLIPCHDGKYRKPEEVYFPSRLVTEILGEEAVTAHVPRARDGIFRNLYLWLGVEEEPRFKDIVSRVHALTAESPDQARTEAVRAIFRFLGDRVKPKEQVPRALDDLRHIAWLPSQEMPADWHYPHALHVGFRRYLYASQARFLDIPLPVQQASTTLLQFLGVQEKPTITQVVDHLLAYASENRVVNKEVYRFLNDAPDQAAVARLKGKACLLLPDETYVRPDQVFWGEHPFGRYRYRLGVELRGLGPLFGELGVRDAPDHMDAMRLLSEIAQEHGPDEPVDEETRTIVLRCWQMVEIALDHDALKEAVIRARLADLRCVPASSRALLRPRETFFEDRAGLADRFGPGVRSHSITRPQGAWRAMAAAGIESLSAAIRTHLIECSDAVEDPLVTERLRRRKVQVARVLESVSGAEEAAVALAVLNQVQCVAVTELTIQHALTAFGHEVRSKAESVPGHHQRESGTLYFVRARGQIPWAPIARELAIALRPDAEPGQISSGLKEVLAAMSAEGADTMLDDLGFPPLQIMIGLTVSDGGIVSDLGGDAAPEHPAPSFTVEAGTASAVPREQSPRPARPAPHGPAAPEPGPASHRGGDRSGGAVGGSSANGSASSSEKKRERRDRLRTYVAPRDEESSAREPQAADAAAAVHRAAVDRAGVDRVMEFERSQGRFPEEMPANHPGYDVISRDSHGVLLRYIEIKSLSGTWDFGDAALSSTQFGVAAEMGEQFWLYVVECATDSAFQIQRIQNPARQVDQFIFDDGWRQLAENVEQ